MTNNLSYYLRLVFIEGKLIRMVWIDGHETKTFLLPIHTLDIGMTKPDNSIDTAIIIKTSLLDKRHLA